MDFEASTLLASIVVSGAGTVAFLYGKKQSRIPHMAIGAVLVFFPYFFSSWFLILAIGVLLLGLLYMAVRLGW